MLALPEEQHKLPQPLFSVHACSWRWGYRQDGSSSSALWGLTLLPRAVGVWFHLWIVSAWQGNSSTFIRSWYKAQYGSIRLHFGEDNWCAWLYIPQFLSLCIDKRGESWSLWDYLVSPAVQLWLMSSLGSAGSKLGPSWLCASLQKELQIRTPFWRQNLQGRGCAYF